ncbi:universal stress protein [Phenylobacterium sp.]|jgi:nucleotide-binding universal stress UspA family protein|uniref:universal stress protein n=1 Tax=Phenylobacterium sp. TaxID=1871053 RepID=UPI0037CA80DE
MYKHILISTDGSDLAQKGLDHGLTLAKGLGAKVTIVTVTERLPVYYGLDAGVAAMAYGGYGANQKEAAEKVLTAAKAAAARMAVMADTVLIEDALPAEAIIEAAKAHDCSLIAMASHGRRGLGRLMMGSVTAEVLAHSPVPVLVVR